jgi:hypothetical protein
MPLRESWYGQRVMAFKPCRRWREFPEVNAAMVATSPLCFQSNIPSHSHFFRSLLSVETPGPSVIWFGGTGLE